MRTVPDVGLLAIMRQGDVELQIGCFLLVMDRFDLIDSSLQVVVVLGALVSDSGTFFRGDSLGEELFDGIGSEESFGNDPLCSSLGDEEEEAEKGENTRGASC